MNQELPYRKSDKGITAILYCAMKGRSRYCGYKALSFSLEEFRTWIFGQSHYAALAKTWRESGFLKRLKPSIDRKNPLGWYTLDNMQLITWEENWKKGVREKLILWGIPIKQLTLDGQLVKEFPNIKAAFEETGINRGNISSVLHAKRRPGHGVAQSAGGFRWEASNPESLPRRWRESYGQTKKGAA